MRPRPVNILQPLPIIILAEGENLDDRLKELNLDEVSAFTTPRKSRRKDGDGSEPGDEQKEEEFVKMSNNAKELVELEQPAPDKGDSKESGAEIFVPEVREIEGFAFDQTPWQFPDELVKYEGTLEYSCPSSCLQDSSKRFPPFFFLFV